MKRSVCIVALMAGIAPPALAQSVTIYGVVDTAVEHVTDVGASGDGLSRMASITGGVPSRLGFRGSEDLGGGLRAVFTLEQGFAPDSGTLGQGGRLFGRQAHVGLAGPWGALSVGRQYTMLFWSFLEADVLGPNLYGAGSLDSYIPNARADNSVAYRGSFGGFTGGASYSLGRDVVNAGPSPAGTNCAGENATDKKACREWSVLLKYDSASWGAALAVDEIRGGAGAFGGLGSGSMKDRRSTLNGYLKFADLKLGAGLLRRDNDANTATPKSDLWFVGATYALTPAFSADGEWFRLNYKSSDNKATMVVLRGTYSLSKRTAVYATLGHISNDGTLAVSVSSGAPGSNPAAGSSQSAFAAGIRHSF